MSVCMIYQEMEDCIDLRRWLARLLGNKARGNWGHYIYRIYCIMHIKGWDVRTHGSRERPWCHAVCERNWRQKARKWRQNNKKQSAAIETCSILQEVTSERKKQRAAIETWSTVLCTARKGRQNVKIIKRPCWETYGTIFGLYFSLRNICIK